MTDHCIIRADFSNWRPIQGRKVMQLIFELPIEEAEGALRMLGIPQPGESKWCAIALLENGKPASGKDAGQQKNVPRPSGPSDRGGVQIGKVPSPTSAITVAAGTSEIHNRDRKDFVSLPLTQQAGIRCADALFQEFLKVETESDAASYVRLYCGVTSRSDLPAFPERWRDLETKYQSWLTDRKFAEAKR